MDFHFTDLKTAYTECLFVNILVGSCTLKDLWCGTAPTLKVSLRSLGS